MAYASTFMNKRSARITLNVERLVRDGVLGSDDATHLRSLAEPSGLPLLAANVFLIFGVILVVAGILALQPPIDAGLGMAVVAIFLGTMLRLRAGQDWGILGRALVLMGILGLCGWTAFRLSDLGAPWPQFVWPGITALLLAGTLAYRDAFLATLVPVALANALGGASGYWHASYGIAMQEPGLSILVFSVLTITLWLISDRMPTTYKNVAVLMARSSFFILNFGFWIGSLWGDYLGEILIAERTDWQTRHAWQETAFFVPDMIFSIGWAVFLIAAMLIGIRRHHRFLANTAVVFLCIHFYTQLHETLLFQPAGIVVSGFLLVGVGMGLVRFDRWQRRASA